MSNNFIVLLKPSRHDRHRILGFCQVDRTKTVLSAGTKHIQMSIVYELRNWQAPASIKRNEINDKNFRFFKLLRGRFHQEYFDRCQVLLTSFK